MIVFCLNASDVENNNFAIIPFRSPGKAHVQPAPIKLIDPISSPKRREAEENDKADMPEKKEKLPIFYQHKIKGKKFELF
jgi:hypothetical protein